MSEVGIADLKAHLIEHLRSVRNGGTVTVLVNCLRWRAPARSIDYGGKER